MRTIVSVTSVQVSSRHQTLYRVRSLDRSINGKAFFHLLRSSRLFLIVSENQYSMDRLFYQSDIIVIPVFYRQKECCALFIKFPIDKKRASPFGNALSRFV